MKKYRESIKMYKDHKTEGEKTATLGYLISVYVHICDFISILTDLIQIQL